MERNLFIDRPYLAIVPAIVITLGGMLALWNLPVSQFPPVAPPQVSITITYPGADAETLMKSVIEPLEKQLNGTPQLIYLDSTASNSGQAVIDATFEVGSLSENHVQNVQNRVNWALPQLPESVQKEGVIVREQAAGILLGITLISPRGTYDTDFLSNYAAIHLRDDLQRIHGVSQVQLLGGSEYAMRIWIDPHKCASLNLPADSVVQALQNQNLQVSAGSLGASPSPPGTRFQYNINTRGRQITEKEFGDIIVRAIPGGAIVRLRDVAKIQLGAENYSTTCTLNQEPTVMMIVYQDNNSNGISIADQCRRILAKKSLDFPPDLQADIRYDVTEFVRAGIHDVIQTLIFAIILVSLVCFIFLQDWRMALIPTLAIPVSIVGSFIVPALFGYSVNTITLFALTLAIGIVVDDAIIVIENVSRLMDEAPAAGSVRQTVTPREAARRSMKEITSAIIGTTAVLLAIFVPVCFFPGISGELYRQFGITLSTAVLISAFNALTLSPALAGLLLRPHEKPSDFFPFRWFNAGFARFANVGDRLLGAMLRVSAVTGLIYLVFAAAAIWWVTRIPPGFLPEEDQGYFFGTLQMPPASSLRHTGNITGKVTEIMQRIPGTADAIAVPGFNILTGVTQPNTTFFIAKLAPWKERLPRGLGAARIRELMQMELTGTITEGFPMLFPPPPIQGIGNAGGFNFVLESTRNADAAALEKKLQELLFAAAENPKLQNVFCDFTANAPAKYLELDLAKATSLGIDPAAIYTALENFTGFQFINEFNRFSHVYKVETQSDLSGRMTPSDLERLQVPNRSGKMVPLRSFTQLKSRLQSPYLRHHNLYPAAEIQGSPAPGTSSGDAMTELEHLANQILTPGWQYEWTDISFQEARAGAAGTQIFLLAFIFVFLFLAALYDSSLLPWTVLPAIPAALAGAAVSLALSGTSLNLYSKIGILLLCAMACKTAILIVDFSEKKHAEIRDPANAARKGAALRLRAVMMTSLAFICGTLPLVFATGAGAAGQRAIGIPVVGGMLSGVLGGILLIPVCYALVRRAANHFRRSYDPSSSKIRLWILAAGLSALLSGGCYTPPPKGRLTEARTMAEAAEKWKPPHKFPERDAPLSLAQAQQIALENNPDYQGAFSAIRAARMRYYQALGAYSPSVTAGLSMGQQLFRGPGAGTFKNSGTSSSATGSSSSSNSYDSFYINPSVQATWILFDGLAREFQLLASIRHRRAEELLGENEKRLLLEAVRHGYRAIQKTRAECRIAEADWKFRSEELRQTQIRLRTGDVSRSDLLNIIGDRNQAELQFCSARHQAEIARFALAELLGLPMGKFPDGVTFPSPAETNKDVENSSLETMLDNALQLRPDLRALREKLKTQEYLYYAAYSPLFPGIAAFANYSYSSDSAYGGGNLASGDFNLSGNSFNYGGYAWWELFNGFRTVNRIRETRSQLDLAFLEGSAQFLKIVKEVRNAHSDVQYCRERLKIARSNREIRREERELVQKSYATGDVEILRLNHAQEQFIQSENELLEAEFSLDRALVRLRSATGENLDLPMPDTIPQK